MPNKKKFGSKAKGSKFEIDICRRLSKWIQGEERPELFWRSSQSGGRATIARRKGQKTKVDGDIMAIDSKGEFFTNLFFIENKSYRMINLTFFHEGKGEVTKWWTKLLQQSSEAKKLPLLIYKANGTKNYLVLEYQEKVFEELSLDVLSSQIVIKKNPNPKIYIFLLEEFLTKVSANEVKRLSKVISEGRKTIARGK